MATLSGGFNATGTITFNLYGPDDADFIAQADNRGGGDGYVGLEAVARAEPDGYTLMIAPPSPLSFNHLLYRDPGYEPTKFVPITLLGAVLVSPAFPRLFRRRRKHERGFVRKRFSPVSHPATLV